MYYMGFRIKMKGFKIIMELIEFFGDYSVMYYMCFRIKMKGFKIIMELIEFFGEINVFSIYINLNEFFKINMLLMRLVVIEGHNDYKF
ncbi:hypothetical protein HanIR_Chr09g0426371 [Helianthus annuus]|nr:hypothetical protein HanIR_Chr09g0426371 [Helianthus annuus]